MQVCKENAHWLKWNKSVENFLWIRADGKICVKLDPTAKGHSVLSLPCPRETKEANAPCVPSPGPRPSQKDSGQPAPQIILPLHNPKRISSSLFQRSWLPEKHHESLFRICFGNNTKEVRRCKPPLSGLLSCTWGQQTRASPFTRGDCRTHLGSRGTSLQWEYDN